MLTHFLLLPALYLVFAETDRLGVQAELAVAVLALQEAGQNFVQLPDIEFRLRVSPHCANGGLPESVSITIADTRKTLGAEELRAKETVEVAMNVAEGQLAPLALRGFCVDSAAEGESVLLTSLLSVQASLRCSRDNDQSIVFSAAALDIRVDCIRTAAAPVDD